MEKESVIILIDDDIEDLEIFSSILSSFQLRRRIIMFETANDFLEYIKATSDKVFLILCDINMPQMNGLELRRAIVTDKELALKCTPFIFFSTFGNSQTITEAYLLPVHGYFEKPSSYEKLQDVLLQIVNYWGHSFRPLL